MINIAVRPEATDADVVAVQAIGEFSATPAARTDRSDSSLSARHSDGGVAVVNGAPRRAETDSEMPSSRPSTASDGGR